jgi:hypothetical protein
MAQPAKVKKALEAASQAKAVGASQAEAKGTLTTWQAVCNDGEASNDLRSLAVHYRDELQAAVIRGDTAAQEAALAALSGLAVRFLP